MFRSRFRLLCRFGLWSTAIATRPPTTAKVAGTRCGLPAASAVDSRSTLASAKRWRRSTSGISMTRRYLRRDSSHHLHAPRHWRYFQCVVLDTQVKMTMKEGMPETPKRTALYRLYDTDERLLYVGITTDPDARWERHALLKWWWKDVARKQLTWLDGSWREALDIEAATIRAERPTYNGSHNHELAPFDPMAWPDVKASPRGKSAALAGLIRAEINAGRWQAGDRLPDALDLAAASGVSKGTVVRAFGELANDGSIRRLHGFGTFVAASMRALAPNRTPAPWVKAP